MPEYSPGQNPAALVLEMVGRRTPIKQIRKVIQRESRRPAVVFIIGKGGIGKTRLLKEAVKADPAGDERLIDFYHIHYHAVDRFIWALYRMLPHPGGLFKKYEREQNLAEHAPYIERQKHREQARQEFIKALVKLSKQQPVVILLDTLERLVYEQESARSSNSDHLSAWRWLVDNLPRLGRVTFLMAGRMAATPLRRELAQLKGIDLLPIDLRPLSKTQSWAYLKAAADACRQTGYSKTADVIEKRLLPDKDRLQPIIHKYTKGSPIFLSLMVDYLSVADPKDVDTLLKGDTTPLKWEAQLMDRLMNDIANGDVIKFMGYLPKGVNLELLTAVMETPPATIGEMFDQVQRFSFVKPAGDRLYLHDEMYKLLADHHLLESPGTGEEAAQVQKGIRSYYKKQIEHQAIEIKALYQMIESEAGIDLRESLASASAAHERLLADDVYYRLRQDFVRGFERWYRYIHEATLSANHELDIRLEFELISFLSDPAQKKWTRNKRLRSLLDFMLGVGVIRRLWAYEDYLGVIEMVPKVRQQYAALLRREPILAAQLNILEAYALDAAGQSQDAAAALDLLDKTIESLRDYEDAPVDEDDVWMWLAKTLLAFAYRVRGYTRRVRGLYDEAVLNYKKALKLFTDTNVRVEIAYTNNDMGFAECEAGRYEDAAKKVEDALKVRYELGIGVFIGLSRNTLGRVYAQQGQYDEALLHSFPALRLFEALEYQRGKGLALNALAEAKRRKSSDLVATERARFLNQALDFANEARAIFEKMGETSRQIESLIEIGCAHRDWVRLCRDTEGTQYCGAAEKHFKACTRALEEAAEKAHQLHILHRHVDSLVNLAWLHYFDGTLDGIEARVRQLEAIVPQGYWINPKTGRPDISPDDPDAQRSVWPQLAKLYVLRGHVLLQHALSSGLNPAERDQALKAAGEMYALAMANDLVFGPEHYGMKRARADIRQKLEKLHVQRDLLRALIQGVIEAERKFKLEPKTRQFLKEAKLWVEN